jgi:hypothetical protein
MTGVVDAKVDLQTQRANTQNRYPKRASRFDLLIDKDEDTSTDNSDTPGSHGQEVLTRNSRIVEDCTRAMQLAESMRTRKKEKYAN